MLLLLRMFDFILLNWYIEFKEQVREFSKEKYYIDINKPN